MQRNRPRALLAASVAGVLAAAGSLFMAGQSVHAEDDKVTCYGINACKGTGDCGGKGHSCSGQNGCHGQGYLSLSKKDCLRIAGGRLTEAVDESAGGNKS